MFPQELSQKLVEVFRQNLMPVIFCWSMVVMGFFRHFFVDRELNRINLVRGHTGSGKTQMLASSFAFLGISKQRFSKSSATVPALCKQFNKLRISLLLDDANLAVNRNGLPAAFDYMRDLSEDLSKDTQAHGMRYLWACVQISANQGMFKLNDASKRELSKETLQAYLTRNINTIIGPRPDGTIHKELFEEFMRMFEPYISFFLSDYLNDLWLNYEFYQLEACHVINNKTTQKYKKCDN
jgi:hypothetical protein